MLAQKLIWLLCLRVSGVAAVLGLGLAAARVNAQSAATPARPFDQIRTDQLEIANQRLKDLAWKDARLIAGYYARTDAALYPGIAAFGRQLGEVLTEGRGKVDFQGVITRNVAFWRAERELATMDVSLPYLVAMMAVLDGDQTTALRMTALAQACLPLGPMLRRTYAQPEALMLYQSGFLVSGVPVAVTYKTIEECEKYAAILRLRLGRWPGELSLLRFLIEIETRRAELVALRDGTPALLQTKVGDWIELAEQDRDYLHRRDAILFAGLEQTIQDWLARRTSAQHWERWTEGSEPAETPELEQAIATYEENGRPDLAWLTWRHALALSGVPAERDRDRWKKWAGQLLGADDFAALVSGTAANPAAGTASMAVPYESHSEAWSGDQNIHPMLAMKLERSLAMLDAMIALAPPGSRREAELRMRKAQDFASIRALEDSRRELRRVAEITDGIGPQITEARLLLIDGRLDEAETLYEKLIENPKYLGVRRDYALTLFVAGKFALARAQMRFLAEKQDQLPDGGFEVMAHLAALRMGEREDELLRSARKRYPPGSWTDTGLRFLLGEVTETDLMMAARRGRLFDVIRQECEAYFWLAQIALADGRQADGIQWLRRCVSTGFVAYVQYTLARIELERLVPPEKGPGKPDRERSSPGVQPA